MAIQPSLKIALLKIALFFEIRLYQTLFNVEIVLKIVQFFESWMRFRLHYFENRLYLLLVLALIRPAKICTLESYKTVKY